MTTQVTPKFMKDARPLIENALATLGTELGVKFELGRGTYSGSNGSFKLELNTIDASGNPQSAESDAFKMYAGESFGDLKDFDPDWLFKEFTWTGGRKAKDRTFILAGYKTRATKKNIEIKDPLTSETFVTSHVTVLRYFEQQYGKYVRPDSDKAIHDGLVITEVDGS